MRQYLFSLGIYPKYKGYRELLHAMQIVYGDFTTLYDVHNNIYVPVAEELHTTPHAIECNLRTVSARAYKVNKAELERVCRQPLNKPLSATNLILTACEGVALLVKDMG